MDSSSEPCADNGRTTLADKLIASGSSAQLLAKVDKAKLEKMSEEQLRETLEKMDRIEREWFERMGRRLVTMLEAVREAKNVARPVQTALAEAMNALRQATGVRKQRQNIAEMLKELEEDRPPDAGKSTIDEAAALSDEGTTKSLLADIALEMKALRHDVNEIRSVQGPGGGNTVNDGTWAEVAKKGKDSKVKGTAAAPPLTKTSDRPKRIRTRPQAIMVNMGSKEDFPALVKKIRGGTNKEVIEDRVVGMRKTRSGDLLIEVKGDADQVEAVRAEVSRSAGDEVEVRTLQQKTLLEIRDLDQWIVKEEVADSVATATGTKRDAVRLLSLRVRYGGTQTALILAPKASCRNVLAQGRIQVGMVSCRIRQVEQKARCFKCLSFGHMSKDCDGPDRSKCCKRCGSQGHFAKDCTAVESDAVAFGKKLEMETSARVATATSGVEPSARQHGLPPN